MTSLTTCCICLERMKDPIKTLPCLHSSCSSCIDELVKKSKKPFKCPQCRSPFEVPSSGPSKASSKIPSKEGPESSQSEIEVPSSELPASSDPPTFLEPNYFTSHLLTSSASTSTSQDPNNIKCDFCEEKEATEYCKDCPSFYCAGCKKPHLKMKATANHRFVSLTEGLKLQSGGSTHSSTPDRITRCHKHPQQEVNSYCKKCKEACCSECVVDGHSTHGAVRLTAISQQFKEDISTLINKVKAHDGELSQAIKETTETLLALKKQTKLTEEHVHQVFDKLRLLLDEREAELIGEIAKESNQKEKELKIQKEDLEFLLKGIRDSVEFGERLMTEGTGVEIAASHKPVVARFKTLETEAKKTPLLPVTDEAIEFVRGEEGVKRSEEITANIGEIATTKKPIFSRDVSKMCPYPRVVRFGSKGESEGQVSAPYGVACNSKREILVADSRNHRIQIFDKDGKFVFSFGSFGKEGGQFNHPIGVAVDFQHGNQIAVTDSSNHRVQIFDRKGKFLHSFGSYGKGEGQFISPYGVAIDQKSGNYFVTDFENHRVQVFASSGKYVRQFGSYGEEEGQFGHPRGIGLLSGGDVVVVEKCGRLQRFDPKGAFANLIADSSTLTNPRFLIVDSDDYILVADSGNNQIQAFDSGGDHCKTIQSKASSDPTGICVDMQGRIIVTERRSNKISIY